MFSVHPNKNGKAHEYANGFKVLGNPEFDDEWRMDYIERAITSRVWSPACFAGGVRLEKNFLGAHICALDFDAPNTPLDCAIQQFKNYSHIIGTTKSHQKEKNGVTCDRYRVVLWFDRLATDLAEYKHNMTLQISTYYADKACKDGARFFFPCKEIVSSNGNGVTIKIDPLPIVSTEKPIRRSGQGFKTFVKVQPAPENRNEAVLKEGIKMFMSNVSRSEIIPMLRIVANGLPEKEFERTVSRAEMYALSKK